MYKTFLFIIVLCFGVLVNAKLIKISAAGDTLQSSADKWACVLDSKTKLVWEVKQSTQGLQNNKNTYTWFDGKYGEENGKYSRHCHWTQQCNTQAFINALNATNLCKSYDWHLPSETELNSLLRYNDDNPLINTDYFPNTKSALYWSSSTVNNVDIAIAVPFFYGGTRVNAKFFDAYVRGVSSAK